MSTFRSCGSRAVAVLCTLALLGCADTSGPVQTLVGPGDGRAYYPLTVGDHWAYTGGYSVTVDSLGVRSTTSHLRVLELEMLPDSTNHDGHIYVSEGSRVGVDGTMSLAWHENYLRQDSKGLYQAIPVGYIRAADHSASGLTEGPGSDATRLVFPLRVGVEWENQDRLHARVEGMEVVSVPAGRFAAWRVALEISSEYANALGHEWYSNVGLVKSEYHWEFQDILYDSAGIQVGLKHFSIDDAFVLQSVKLVGPQGRLVPATLARR